MTQDEIEDLYNLLCNRLTQAGEGNTDMVLARLAMLLMQNMTDAALAASLIEEAAQGYTGAVETTDEHGA
ncbi:hypothetical protein CSC67_14960 [Pusillimonas caeni]|uniref:hypothetical protein n=1 Tax=Pusillimonas caeni TaxID=1348472 RepID=UPI000E59C8D8|nr:hypothetical protein [Pusillimonas caeni]TFL13191.1 hypothetical protein CSC67_14960 [Pusillimonas caeni]